MSGINDPFAFQQGLDPSQQSTGAFGVPMSAWQHLAMFGGNLAAAANARTPTGHLAYGAGFAGPFGAAVGQTMQEGMGQAATGANIGRVRAETQQEQLKNQVLQAQVPFEQYKARLSLQLAQDPNFAASLYGGQPGAPNVYGTPAFTGQPQSTPAGNAPLARVKDQLESGGRMAPGIVGDSGAAAGPSQVHQAALNDVNAHWGTNYTLAQLTANPQLGKQVGDMYLAMQQQRYPGRPDLALAAYNAGPGAVDKAVQGGQGIAALPPSTQGYVQRGMSMLNDFGTGINPASALVQSQQLMAQAADLERRQSLAKFLGLPMPPGDSAVLRQQANAYTNMALAGPQAGAEAAGKAGVEMQTAPQIAHDVESAKNLATLTYSQAIEKAKALGSFQVKPQSDRFGNWIIGDGKGGVIYLGRGAEVKEQYNPATDMYHYGNVGGEGIGNPANIGQAFTPQQLAQQQATGQGAGGTGGIAKPGPQSESFGHERGTGLGMEFRETDESAEAAKDSNYLFDNMRRDSQTWDMGKFAPFEGEARAWLSAVGHSFDKYDAQGNKIGGLDLSRLDKPLADYQAFNKSSGQLLRAAVHDTSSRAALQEYKLIGESLPTPSTSQEAFGQVADQWQGLNDYRLAKQKFMQGYKTHPQDFESDFNQRVSPTSFMLNRMSQTPEGQQTLTRMLAKMQSTETGKIAAGKMLQDYRYAKSAGLFDDLPPMPAPGR